MKKILLVTLLVMLVLTSNGIFANGVKEYKPAPEVQEFSYVRQGIIEKGLPTNKDEITIAIAATSDVHGRIYPWEYAIDSSDNDAGYAMTYTVVKKLRKEYPELLLIDVGDTVQDNSSELFNDMDTHPMVEAMNYMDYDVWVPGNHEFNFGLPFLQRNFENFEGRVVCANVEYASDGRDYLLPYQIFNVEGVRVAVVGGVAPHIPLWEASAPDHFQGLEFTNPVESVKKVVKAIEGQYDVLVAAMHMSRLGQYDQQDISGAFHLAEQVPEVDLIFAGHEHATYVESVNDTWVLEPGRYGNKVSVGKITVVKENGKWKVKEVEAENIKTKGLEASAEIEERFKSIHDKSRENATTVIGEITKDFLPEGVDFITGAKNVTTMPRTQIEDTAVVDLINTVQMKYANADVSSAAVFKANQTLFKGDFQKKDVAFIYKYNNTLMGVNITGENLIKYMEWSMKFYNTFGADDVTISFNPEVRGYNYDMFAGVNYKVDISKDAGNRVVDLTFNGKPIDLNKKYKLAVNNYRFGTLKKLGFVTDSDIYYDSYNEDQLNSEVRALIIKYVQEDLNGKLTPVCDRNWKLIGLGKHFNDQSIIDKIKNGEIEIPKSSDGRTLNVEAVKYTK